MTQNDSYKTAQHEIFGDSALGTKTEFVFRTFVQVIDTYLGTCRCVHINSTLKVPDARGCRLTPRSSPVKAPSSYESSYWKIMQNVEMI